MQVSGGDLVDGQIQIVNRTGSQSQTYDQAGDVIRTLTTDGTQVLTQTSTWDSRGELIGDTLAGGDTETRRYDADGRVTVVDTYYAPNTTMYVDPPDDDAPAGSPMDIGNWLESATLTSYDADGRVLTSTNYGRQHEDWDADWPTRFSHQQEDPGSTGYGLLTEHSQVTYGSSGYDNEGNAIGYSYAAENSYGQWYTTTYTVSYLRKDGYLEKATHGTSNQPNVLATTDTSIYDAFGRRIAIDTQTATLTTDPVRVFAYDANGEILERRDGSAANDTSFSVTDNGGYAVHHYAYVNGQQIGDVDEHGTIDVLSGVTGFSNTDQGTSDYVVQDGDTLQSIAQTVYGDANLWYVVADANGLQSSDDLAAGQTLKLPEVTTNSNTSTTFKPYNPRQISGSTTPSLPQAPQPAPSAHGCSGLAVVIVAVVAAFVAPEIEPYLAAAFSGTTVAAVTAGTALVSEATTVAAWFVSGVAANTAGQLASDAVGASNGYSFKEALVAGAGAAVAGGLTAEMENTPGGIWATSSTHLSPEGAAVVGAADYASTAAAEKLVGLPSQFSWAGLVAAGVSAGATNAAGLSTAQSSTLGAGGTFGQSFAGGLVQGTLNREISQGLGDDRVESWGQIAEDAFGNALGNAAVGAINEAQWKAAQPSINKQVNTAIDNIWGDDRASDGSSDYATTVRELQLEAAEDPTYGPVTLPTVELGTGDGASGLTSDELARLATTTHYSGTYVDPYLIGQNGGNANWAYDVQTFRDPDLGHSVITELPVPAAASVEDSDTDGQNTALRIIGSFIGIGRATEKTAVGAVTLAGSWVGTGIDDVVGQNGLGITNYFHADTTAFQSTVDNTAQFLSNHPVAAALNAWNTALNRAAELATSSNAADQIESGDILGQLSFNTVMAADGAAGLGKLGLSGASLVADGVGDLAETLSQVRFAGSADSYVSFAPQIGAVGEDLSGFTPNIGGTLDEVDAAPVQPLGMPDSVPTAAQLRNTPGVVTVSSDLTPASGDWLNAAVPTPIPAQIGDALAGMKFNTFDDLRSAIWEQIGNNPELNSGFTPRNVQLMRDEYAPLAPPQYLNENGAFGKRFNLHHVDPIGNGGAVYDLSNLQIVSPKVHYDIHY